MAESVVLPLLVEAAKPMIQALRNRAVEETSFVIGGFTTRLNKLQQKIEPVASIVLNMTDHADEAVESWLRNIVRILYNVEDMLDVLAYEKQRKDVMKSRPKKPFTGKTGFFFWPLKQAYFRRTIGRWISKIITNIDEAMAVAKTIEQLNALVPTSSSLPSSANEGLAVNGHCHLQQLRRNVDMSLIVGRDSDVDSVVDKLCNPSHHSDNFSSDRLFVMALLGLGGIGKTVLAKKVVENKQVTEKFSQRIWIVVSEDFSILKILNKMLEFVDMSSGGIASSSEEIAIRKLKEKLDGKKYLLVLDDVWNTHKEIWNAMRSSLVSIGGSEESMILVTTRSKVVAQTMQASSIYELPELSGEDSWVLFKKVAFENMPQGYTCMLETTGRKIVQKCNGVPLAIKTIGGILQTKNSLAYWEKIEKSEIWDLPQDDYGILPSLKLSYNHLPSPFLKKCFSFCAIIPKDYKVNKEWLTCCWMALGLIQKSSAKTDLLDDIAEEYINTLLSISFLHEEERDEIGEISWYGMHDLVCDLARSVSRHDVLLLEAGNQVTATSDVRHLSIYKNMEVTSVHWDKLVLENLRTLDFSSSNLPGESLLKHVKYLRVLDLGDSGLQVVPKSIAGLKCLKYLSLEDNPIKVLPEFITELYSLQYLNLEDCALLDLPGGLSNLVNLRHLRVSKLKSFPAGMIGQLKCLQTLPHLCVSEGGFNISELGCLSHVSDCLEIGGLQLIKSKQAAETAKLSEKSRVQRLKLFWNSDYDWIKHEEVLEGLKPTRNLRLLSIEGYGGEKFPSWLMRMDVVYNLVKIIELVDCQRCQKLPTLGLLPSLEKLKIGNMDRLENIGKEFYCYSDMLTETASSSSSFGVKSMVYFPSLKQLQLCELQSLTKWDGPSSDSVAWTIFPSLEKLKLKHCPKLRATSKKFPHLLCVNNTIDENINSLILMRLMESKGCFTSLKNLKLEIGEFFKYSWRQG